MQKPHWHVELKVQNNFGHLFDHRSQSGEPHNELGRPISVWGIASLASTHTDYIQ